MPQYEYSVRIKTVLDTSGIPEEHRKLLGNLEKEAQGSAQRVKKAVSSVPSAAQRAVDADAPIIIRRWQAEAKAVEDATQREINAIRRLTDEERRARTQAAREFNAAPSFAQFERQLARQADIQRSLPSPKVL
jgi:hypothetical protein